MHDHRADMKVRIASPLRQLSMDGVAGKMCGYVIDASTRPRSHRETGRSSFNSLGLKSSVSLARTPSDLLVTSDRWEGVLSR